MHEILSTAWKTADAWRVGKYMIMPDHIHLFCSPADRDVSLKAWVTYWKSLVSRAQQGHGAIADNCSNKTEPSNLFQRDFWDTQLRQGEHYAKKWAYVQNNPVRAELVKHSKDWKFQGEQNTLVWLKN